MAAEAVWDGEVTVLGNKRVAMGTVTMSGLVSGAFQPGLGYVEGGVLMINTSTTNATHYVAFNKASGDTATYGYVKVYDAVDGDVLNCIIWGQ